METKINEEALAESVESSKNPEVKINLTVKMYALWRAIQDYYISPPYDDGGKMARIINDNTMLGDDGHNVCGYGEPKQDWSVDVHPNDEVIWTIFQDQNDLGANRDTITLNIWLTSVLEKPEGEPRIFGEKGELAPDPDSGIIHGIVQTAIPPDPYVINFGIAQIDPNDNNKVIGTKFYLQIDPKLKPNPDQR